MMPSTLQINKCHLSPLLLFLILYMRYKRVAWYHTWPKNTWNPSMTSCLVFFSPPQASIRPLNHFEPQSLPYLGNPNSGIPGNQPRQTLWHFLASTGVLSSNESSASLPFSSVCCSPLGLCWLLSLWLPWFSDPLSSSPGCFLHHLAP